MRRGRRTFVVSAGLLVVAAAACTVPDYKFAAENTTPIANDGDASKPIVDAGPPDDPEDAAQPVQPYDGAAMTTFPMELPSTNDFVTDCMFVNIPFTNRQVVTDPAGPLRRCTIFFFAEPWRRVWTAARDACAQIKRGSKSGSMLTLLSKAKAEAVEALFPDNMTAWVGLSLNPGGDPLNRTSWTWVTGAPLAYDGWAAGHPSGGGCGNWSNPAAWGDLDCATPKGFLCEVDE